MKKTLIFLACLLLLAGCGSEDAEKPVSSNKPSTPEDVQCTLDTVPAAAGVWDGGTLLGRTPLTVKYPSGKKLALKYPGCATMEIQLEKDAIVRQDGGRVSYTTDSKGGLAASVEIPPEEEPSCVILCKSVPEGAEVLLDGELRGTTPLELRGLAPKAYELSFKLSDRELVTRKILWKEGETRQVVEVRLANQKIEFYKKKIEEEPMNLLHYADLGHQLVLDGELSEAVSVMKSGIKLILDGNKPQDPARLWAEIERIITVQYAYGDDRTVEVARRILLGMLDEIWDEYAGVKEIRDPSYYRNYVNVADRLKLRDAAQEKLDIAFKYWPNDRVLQNYLKRGYKKK